MRTKARKVPIQVRNHIELSILLGKCLVFIKDGNDKWPTKST
jgi:hypothetical protein